MLLKKKLQLYKKKTRVALRVRNLTKKNKNENIKLITLKVLLIGV